MPQFWFLGIHLNMFEEGIDGRTQGRERRHGPLKVLGLQGRIGLCRRCFDGSVQGLLLVLFEQ